MSQILVSLWSVTKVSIAKNLVLDDAGMEHMKNSEEKLMYLDDMVSAALRVLYFIPHMLR